MSIYNLFGFTREEITPKEYGYDNLLAIQKDNQNTVTISTGNKIGLSNTQRFYATA